MKRSSHAWTNGSASLRHTSMISSATVWVDAAEAVDRRRHRHGDRVLVPVGDRLLGAAGLHGAAADGRQGEAEHRDVGAVRGDADHRANLGSGRRNCKPWALSGLTFALPVLIRMPLWRIQRGLKPNDWKRHRPHTQTGGWVQ